MSSGFPDFNKGYYFMGQKAGVMALKEWVSKLGAWKIFGTEAFVGAGSSLYKELYTVPSGKTYLLTDFFCNSKIHSGDIKARLEYWASGSSAGAPIVDLYVTDVIIIDFATPVTLFEGDTLKLWLKNDTSTDTYIIAQVVGIEVS